MHTTYLHTLSTNISNETSLSWLICLKFYPKRKLCLLGDLQKMSFRGCFCLQTSKCFVGQWPPSQLFALLRTYRVERTEINKTENSCNCYQTAVDIRMGVMGGGDGNIKKVSLFWVLTSRHTLNIMGEVWNINKDILKRFIASAIIFKTKFV